MHTQDVMKTIRIPRRFYDDHRGRDLPTPAMSRRTKRHVYIDATASEIPELISDAYYYATGGYGFEFAGVVSSAKATVRALEAGLLAAASACEIDEISARVLAVTGLADMRDWSEAGWCMDECGCLRRMVAVDG